MAEESDQILDVVAENPGATVEEITDLVSDHGISNTDVPNLLSEVVTNEDLLVFDSRYWVMRTGKYQFDRYDHPKT
ncbi:hypothetical protein [Haloterrigena alkaliphila]|uniref:hypothetical protein n=1 Tax=Haloterrigena alkaliphila TaxID=2816475 RepID=UPI001CFF7732|nr:hypothetical protein [Haloterrigena alkaliphila]UHQ95077.1 hypothetical protein J0X25_19670 [Haloterrigena alkaliphila]